MYVPQSPWVLTRNYLPSTFDACSETGDAHPQQGMKSTFHCRKEGEGLVKPSCGTMKEKDPHILYSLQSQ